MGQVICMKSQKTAVITADASWARSFFVEVQWLQ